MKILGDVFEFRLFVTIFTFESAVIGTKLVGNFKKFLIQKYRFHVKTWVCTQLFTFFGSLYPPGRLPYRYKKVKRLTFAKKMCILVNFGAI